MVGGCNKITHQPTDLNKQKGFSFPDTLTCMIDWPANSPDLSPTENVRSWMKREVEQRRPTNKAELQAGIPYVWDGLTVIDIENYLCTMIAVYRSVLKTVVVVLNTNTKLYLSLPSDSCAVFVQNNKQISIGSQKLNPKYAYVW